MSAPAKLVSPYRVSRRALMTRILIMTVGTLIGAISVIVFFAPFNIAPSGISGLAVILNRIIGTPIGLVTMIGNLPILVLAYRMLGGWQAVLWTVYCVGLASVAIDMLTPFFPTDGVSNDFLLNAMFAGMIGGVGGGLVYRAGGTPGGTSTLARILQDRYGTPLSSTYMYTNIAVILVAGVLLGWESALYSFIALLMEGIASDYILEGPSVIRTVIIVTDRPREVADVILYEIQRGVTGWQATGMYTQQTRHILFVTIPRSQVNTLRSAVLETDPAAFVVVGHGHIAYGEGFHPPSSLLGD